MQGKHPQHRQESDRVFKGVHLDPIGDFELRVATGRRRLDAEAQAAAADVGCTEKQQQRTGEGEQRGPRVGIHGVDP
jgi:hypothetical protein